MKPAFKGNKEEKKTDGGERRMKKIGLLEWEIWDMPF